MWPVSTVDYRGIANSALYIGMLVGSFFWSAMADTRGRKPVVVRTLVLIALSTAGLAAVAQVPLLFTLVKLGTGFAVGGLLPSTYTLVAECAKPSSRRQTLILFKVTALKRRGVPPTHPAELRPVAEKERDTESVLHTLPK